jgi:hypothetical protein
MTHGASYIPGLTHISSIDFMEDLPMNKKIAFASWTSIVLYYLSGHPAQHFQAVNVPAYKIFPLLNDFSHQVSSELVPKPDHEWD